jgi:hypothetical protein
LLALESERFFAIYPITQRVYLLARCGTTNVKKRGLVFSFAFAFSAPLLR